MPVWHKGQSGNPKGRPPRSRTMSAMLAVEGSKKIGRRTRKEIVAQLLWEFAVSGTVQMGDQLLVADDPLEWFNAVKWIYNHLDGPAPVTDPEDNELVVRIEHRDKPLK